jgi:uncharacterized protein with HEPN domain
LPEQRQGRDWTLFLQDMRMCSSKVLRYSSRLTKQQFLDDELVLDAVPRNLE